MQYGRCFCGGLSWGHLNGTGGKDWNFTAYPQKTCWPPVTLLGKKKEGKHGAQRPRPKPTMR